MKRNHQEGSTHVIIIAVLTIALIGAIGTLFWQNVLSKSSQVATTASASASPSTSPTPSLKSYCAPLEKLCFDYPDNWTVKSDKLGSDDSGIAERITVSDQSGESWLRLTTGMGGVGGTCGNDDNSYAKVLKTHTTAITGSYLVNAAAKDYFSDTAYAIGWITYDGANKNFTANMELNNAKAIQTIGRLDPCDVGIGLIDGKNAKSDGLTTPGAVEFKYYTGSDESKTYATEAEASAALSTTDAVKAYDVLQSAHYE